MNVIISQLPVMRCCLTEVSARYVLGLTATPDHRMASENYVYGCGPVRHKVRAEAGSNLSSVPSCGSVMNTIYRPLAGWRAASHSISLPLACRNAFPIRTLFKMSYSGCKIRQTAFCSPERREHAETLATLLEVESISSVVLHGGCRPRSAGGGNSVTRSSGYRCNREVHWRRF